MVGRARRRLRSPATWTRACSAGRARRRAPPASRSAGSWRDTRDVLARERQSYQPWWRRAGYRALAHHRLVLAGSSALGAAQRGRLLSRRRSRRLGLPDRLPVRRPQLRPSGNDVWLFTGCVMDAWQRDVHAAAQRVVEATGAASRCRRPRAARAAAARSPCTRGSSEHRESDGDGGDGVDARRRADPRRLRRDAARP